METAPAKQQRRPPPAAGEGEPEAKRSRLPGCPDSAGGHRRVVLNPADCDLDFDIDGNGLQGRALHEEGFAYCWSGARATVGITGGKYCFGFRIISEQKVQMEDTAPDQRHLCRLGISRGDDSEGSLGESDHSFGFGGTGKFSAAGNFYDYGAKFGVGDTITCAVNLESRPLASIGYSLNGKWLGSAKQFDAGPKGLGVLNSVPSKLSWGSALFPHILLKNVVVQMQFSIEDGLIPEEGYKPWRSALEGGHAVIGPSFPALKECEVMMMVGLPASGKTTWAEKWVKDHPEKRYVLLGTNLALEHMKVPGVLCKRNYGGRSDLMDRATKMFTTLLSRACKTPHNYIIEQTNTYKSARKRILQPFVHFRKIAVVVFPTIDELKSRQKSRAERQFHDMGKRVPAEPVKEMLAHYVLPVSKDMPCADECFDEVTFPELDRSEAQFVLDKIKRVLRFASNLSARTNFSSFNPPSSVTGKVDSDLWSDWSVYGPGYSVPGGFGERNLRSQKDNLQSPLLEVDMSGGSQGCPVVGSTNKSPQQTEGEIIQHVPMLPVSPGPSCHYRGPRLFPVSPGSRRCLARMRQGSFKQPYNNRKLASSSSFPGTTGVDGHNNKRVVVASTDDGVFPEHGIEWPDARQGVVPFVGAEEMLDTLIAGVLTLFQGEVLPPSVESVRSALRSGTRAYHTLGLPRDPWMTAVESTWEEFRRAHAASRLKIQRLKDDISALCGEFRELHDKFADARGRRGDLEAKQDSERTRRFHEADRKLEQQLQAEEAFFTEKLSDLGLEIAGKRFQLEVLRTHT